MGFIMELLFWAVLAAILVYAHHTRAIRVMFAPAAPKPAKRGQRVRAPRGKDVTVPALVGVLILIAFMSGAVRLSVGA